MVHQNHALAEFNSVQMHFCYMALSVAPNEIDSRARLVLRELGKKVLIYSNERSVHCSREAAVAVIKGATLFHSHAVALAARSHCISASRQPSTSSALIKDRCILGTIL